MWKNIFTIRRCVEDNGTWCWEIDRFDSTDWTKARGDWLQATLLGKKIKKLEGDALRLCRMYNALELRSRFNTDVKGPFIIETDEQVSGDVLDQYIQSFPPDKLMESLNHGQDHPSRRAPPAP